MIVGVGGGGEGAVGGYEVEVEMRVEEERIKNGEVKGMKDRQWLRSNGTRGGC